MYQSRCFYIIDLIDFGFSDRAEPCQKFGHTGRREKFTARLARIGSVHGHQIFISIAECVNVVILHVTKVHICHADEKFAELFVSLCHRRAQLVAIDVEVVKQSHKLPLGLGAFRGFLNMAENSLQRFVEIFVRLTTGKNIAKQLARQLISVGMVLSLRLYERVSASYLKYLPRIPSAIGFSTGVYPLFSRKDTSMAISVGLPPTVPIHT